MVKPMTFWLVGAIGVLWNVSHLIFLGTNILSHFETSQDAEHANNASLGLSPLCFLQM